MNDDAAAFFLPPVPCSYGPTRTTLLIDTMLQIE